MINFTSKPRYALDDLIRLVRRAARAGRLPVGRGADAPVHPP